MRFGGAWVMTRRRQVSLQTGPFQIRLDTDCAPLVATLVEFYPHLVAGGEQWIHNFHVSLCRPFGPRRWTRPQIRFLVDEGSPFEPYPLDHAFPLFEWGVNWCIAMRAHQYLMLHAAVVERNGGALMLPALPGSGKSTLCAALALRRWRLLSDEFGLFDLNERVIAPLPRAVPLKNESIAVIRAFDPAAYLGPLFAKTRKGDVAHLRPPGDSLLRQREPARPRWIVFPRFERGHRAELRVLPKSEAFVRLAQNSFNYAFLRAHGFSALSEIVTASDCYSLVFGSLAEAIAILDATCVG